ncbi:MAG: hypothetical protein IPF52_05980 [Saprospiraceae bacterium]|nr:hypothetical protein [Saprospiraceae bacterium]
MKIFGSIILAVVLFHSCSFQSQETDPVKDENPVIGFTGNIMVSDDGGKTWHTANPELPENFVPISVNYDENNVILGSNYGDIYKLNRGDLSKSEKENTLTAMPSVEPKDYHSVTGIFNGPSGQYVYINGTGIFHKKHNVGFWEPIPVPEGVYYVGQVKEDDKNNIYIATPYGVYHTVNKGETWDKIFKYGFAHSIIVYPDRLIVNGINGVYLSDDAGKTWTVNTSLNIQTNDNKNGNSTIYQDGDNLLIVKKLASSAYDTGTEYVLYHSNDRGVTWAKHPSNDFLQDERDIYSMTLNKNKLFCSINQGLMSSEDNGKTWTKVLSFPEDKNNYGYRIFEAGEKLICVKMFMGC